MDTSEPDDRIIRPIMATTAPRLDTRIEIRYAEPLANKCSFFKIAPLMQSLRALLLASLKMSSLAPCSPPM